MNLGARHQHFSTDEMHTGRLLLTDDVLTGNLHSLPLCLSLYVYSMYSSLFPSHTVSLCPSRSGYHYSRWYDAGLRTTEGSGQPVTASMLPCHTKSTSESLTWWRPSITAIATRSCSCVRPASSFETTITCSVQAAVSVNHQPDDAGPGAVQVRRACLVRGIFQVVTKMV